MELPALSYVANDYIERVGVTYHHGNLRQALLDRAAEVIADKGVEALSLRGLARDIGVSHAAPARHFKDKTALLAALAAEGHKLMVKTLNAAAEAAGHDPVARYNAMGKAEVRFSLRNPAYYKALNHPEVNQQADEELIAANRAYMLTVREAAAAAQEAGWRKGADTEALFVFSTAAAVGTASLFSNMFQSGIFEGVELDALADKVIDLVIPPSADQCSPD